MVNFAKAFILLNVVYGTVLFIMIAYPTKELKFKTEMELQKSRTFLAAELGDDDKISEENTTELNSNTENEDSKDKIEEFQIKLQESKTEIKSTTKPKSKPVQPKKFVLNSNPFSLLGAYPDPNPYVKEHDYDSPHYGIIHDKNYCTTVDLYNLAHPANMFQKMNFYTDIPKGSMMKRRVMSQLGKIFMDDVERNMSIKTSASRTYHIDKEITVFHTSNYHFHKFHQIGKHYLCATQMFNHIPNHTELIRKEYFPQSLQRYSLKYKDMPQCFDKNSFYPATYRLFVKDECEEFFDIINSEQYNASLETEPVQYLVKAGQYLHKAQGVFLLDQNMTDSLNNDYNKGKECGKVENLTIVQKYLANPLLLDNNNKFHMRVYVLIASTNPFIVYYHDGYIRASILPFDKHSEDRATHLTNLLMGNKVAQALNQTDNNITQNKTAKELEDYYLWSFEDLEKYLIESGKTTDKKWLDNHLRPALQKAFIHVVRMTGGSFWKQSNVYELLGCDFMLDENFGVWFIEANANPLLDGVKPQMITQMLLDLFEIEYAYYRSRMKRVFAIVKKMLAGAKNRSVENLSEFKKMYQEAAKNRLEPEYKISKKNTFKLIMDENLPGAQAYFGVLPEECVKE